jgi:flagellar protein FlaI
MREIATDRGWDDERLERELDERERLIAYLAEERITGYAEVAAAIQLYDRDASRVIDRLEAGTLSAAFLAEHGPDVELPEAADHDVKVGMEEDEARVRTEADEATETAKANEAQDQTEADEVEDRANADGPAETPSEGSRDA